MEAAELNVDTERGSMDLTDAAIKALKPRSIRYYVTDGRGLSLEIFPSGSMAWRFRYRLNGKPEKTALGRYPEMSLKAARHKRDEMASMVARGQSPAGQKRLAKVALASATTTREFGERYYKEVVLCSVKDPKNLRRWLDKEIYPVLGHKPLRDISAADVQTIVFRKRDNGSPASAAAIRNLIKRIFDYAIVCGVALTNPTLATPMRFVTKARPRTRALSPVEITAYIQTLYRSNIRRQFKLALHIILLTLVRKSELLFAKWQDVDFDSCEWQIPQENSKTGQSHIVYMSSQVVELFHELKVLAGDSEWVLPSRSSLAQPFAKNSLNQALEGVNFPIDPFTIHDLRRTGSTRLHEQGFSSDVVEKALNHTIGGVRGVYNRAEYAEQRKEMLQVWADYVGTLATENRSLFPAGEGANSATTSSR
jgi:integrase